MLNTKRFIYLYTAQHTGTHFVSNLLQLHPEISFTIMDMESWDEVFSFIQNKYVDFHNSYATLNSNKFGGRFALDKVKYFLLHTHVKQQNDWMFTSFDSSSKIIITLRDPLLSVISSLLRTGKGRNNSYMIIDFIKQQSSLSTAFFFPVDLWSTSKHFAFNIFDYLGLGFDSIISQYIESYKVVNSTRFGNIASSYPEHFTLDIEEVFEAKEMYNNSEIHPILQPYFDYIRKIKLQKFYERLGYKNLLWYE